MALVPYTGRIDDREPYAQEACPGLSRLKWENLSVVMKSEDGQDVGLGLCRDVNPKEVDDVCQTVYVLIKTTLNETVLPSDWRFSLRRWPLQQVFFEGYSLAEHERVSIQNEARHSSCNPPRQGSRQYISGREPNISGNKKRDRVCEEDELDQVINEECCNRRCLRLMFKDRVKEIRKEYWKWDHKMKAALKLDIHRRIHIDENQQEVVTFDNEEICLLAWRRLYSISKSDFYRFGERSRAGDQANHHGNKGIKKQRNHTLQAIASLGAIIENKADSMPHKFRTLPNGERVTEKVLPTGSSWKDFLEQINIVQRNLGLKEISASCLSKIRKSQFSEYIVKRRGDNFARCGTCDDLKRQMDESARGSAIHGIFRSKYDMHIAEQSAHRQHYYATRCISSKEPTQLLSIIHDKMDHSKTASPCIAKKSKGTDGFMRLPVAVTGMIAHGHVDQKYAHFSLDLYPSDSNSTIGSVAKLLRDLENPSKSESRILFDGSGSTPLFEAILEGKEKCLESLPVSPLEPKGASKLAPILSMQLDNSARDNKSRYVFCFWSLLVARGVFREVYVSFLIVGHTHDDIDALFGRWSMRLREKDFPTIPLLMKSFMDLEALPVIPDLIEEVPDFKNFIADFIAEGSEELVGHSKAQQFKFYLGDDGQPYMQYKLKCTDSDWKPEGGVMLWKVVDNKATLPSGEPRAVRRQYMRNRGEIIKGIAGHIQAWRSLIDTDMTHQCDATYGPLVRYWEGVRDALVDEQPDDDLVLKNGFWPNSRVQRIHNFLNDGRVREEFDRDEDFIGRRQNRPQESYRVGRDCYSGYFVLLAPGEDDDDYPKPVWLARALSDPILEPTDEHFKQIHVEYYMPVARGQDIQRYYTGWDTNRQFKWKRDPNQPSIWIDTDALLASWKPKLNKTGEYTLPVKQIRFARDNLDRIREHELQGAGGGISESENEESSSDADV